MKLIQVAFGSLRTPVQKLAGLTLLAMVAGCGVATDDRPADFTYIVEAVLAPSCGTATCHSTLSKEADIAFDTVANAKLAFARRNLVDPGNPSASEIIQVLQRPSDTDKRMPPDGPIPNEYIDLISAWITAGAVIP